MDIDPRLNDIDDWWALPGGGIDHGESIERTVTREIEEELGVSADEVQSNFEIVYYNIGSVVNAVPRMNLFFKVTVPEASIKKTSHVSEWKWFTKDEF